MPVPVREADLVTYPSEIGAPQLNETMAPLYPFKKLRYTLV